MGIALWVVQLLLAAAFLVSGATKLSQPREKLVKIRPPGCRKINWRFCHPLPWTVTAARVSP
jgi:hypothetical protein